ncbi:MAG TPA: ABC transporter ATP-binding protein [Candidatus Methanoperedens sp.]|nr:ABC transporter ATP-binding protein [Candidatus Methanoperedens sp.]
MSAAPPAIAIHGLTKRYGRTLAVDNLTLEVSAGEIFGFLGLNGAGKSTTIRTLLDLLRPTAGSAFVFGRNCRTESLAVRAAIGYLPGEIVFPGDLTGRRVLDLLDRLGAARVRPAYQRQLLERLALSPADLDRRLREYSTGMKRKLGLLQALQADPPLLLLDEPTEGLDPLMQEAVYGLLAEVRCRGRTVFMSSHVLPEVERVCDRIGVLRAGRLALVATVEEVRRLAPRRVRVTFAADVLAPDAPWPAGVEPTEVVARGWTLSVRGPLGGLVQRLTGLPVADLRADEPRLEDVVIDYYRAPRPGQGQEGA